MESIKLENWKCFSSKELSFGDNQVLIVGNNGAGKTSVLQALHFLHEFRLTNGIHWKDCIKKSEQRPPSRGADKENQEMGGVSETSSYANITLQLPDKPPMRAHFSQEKGTIRLFIGDKSVTRKAWSEHLSHETMYIDSMSLNILYLSPSLRRGFLDEILSSSSPKYAKILKDYGHILTQRNKLLGAIKDGRSREDELAYWDDQIIDLASKIYETRSECLAYIQEYGNHLSDTLKQKYQLSFLYESKLSLPEDIGNQMRSYFEQNRNKEILLCRTLRGPHLDDWSIQVMGENEPIASTNYLSRGENKMIFLALVKILSNFIESKTSKPILYLLDDVFAELDDEKRDVIGDLIQDHSAILSSQNPHDGWETVELNN